jgi:hypothetical protein
MGSCNPFGNGGSHRCSPCDGSPDARRITRPKTNFSKRSKVSPGFNWPVPVIAHWVIDFHCRKLDPEMIAEILRIEVEGGEAGKGADLVHRPVTQLTDS